MRLDTFLVEFSREKYGNGITFVDIDETMFRTFAKILVMKDGSVIRELSNSEFNSYTLQPGESFDFRQFRSAKIFKETSIPIQQTINRIKRMMSSIDGEDKGSMIVFLTARADFDDKEQFLDTFREYGINVDSKRVYVERTGNMSTGTVDERKKKTMLKYMATGKYRRVRLIDDYMENLKALKDIERNVPESTLKKVATTYNLDMSKEKLPIISFYTLHVQPDGSLRRV